MSDIKFVVELNDIDKVKRISDESIKRALNQCGSVWETSAKALTPVDTGRLRNSIKHKEQGKNTEVVETNVEYAVYVHEGARGRLGRPFIRMSGERLVNTFKRIIENELKR